jgi:hypothetical protein
MLTQRGLYYMDMKFRVLVPIFIALATVLLVSSCSNENQVSPDEERAGNKMTYDDCLLDPNTTMEECDLLPDSPEDTLAMTYDDCLLDPNTTMEECDLLPDSPEDTLAMTYDDCLLDPNTTMEECDLLPDSPEDTLVEENPGLTLGQESALRTGQQYIDMTGFSKKGLIQQLSSPAGNGYSRSDAIFAANNVVVDWNAEAVEAAESYLDIIPMSKNELIQQLSSPAGSQFTPAQARYAANRIYSE